MKLKPLNAEIQICPRCGKVDAYKNDGHSCEAEFKGKNQMSIINE